MAVKRKQVPTQLKIEKGKKKRKKKERKKENRDQRSVHAYALLFPKEDRGVNIPGFLCLQPQAKESAT